MPDPTPPPAPAPKKQSHGIINKAYTADLNDTDVVCAAAASAAFSAPLASRDVSALFVSTLQADVALCRKDAAKAAQADFYTQKKTKLEATAKKVLLDAMHYFQKVARLKFPDDVDTQHQFFIGQDLSSANRPDLETFVAGMSAKLAVEPLTAQGVTAAEITGLDTKLEAWQDADTDQSNAALAAQTLHGSVTTQLASIITRRTKIKLTADIEWPHTDPANAPTRRAFTLPPEKPYIA
ncbi:MAG: hypothetical protein HY300_13235 [Verrucomicrobia bacterium]|nr:hypothetical protein [Verrucomicrobiota bacterium]